MSVTQKKSIAIVGSGPFHLAKGVELLKLGHKTVIFDRNSYAGGAWAALPVFRENTRHDVVAHLLSPFPVAYELIQKSGFQLRQRKIYFLIYHPNSEHLSKMAWVNDNENPVHLTSDSIILGWHQYYALLEKNKVDCISTLDQQKSVFNSFLYFSNNMDEFVNSLTKNYLDYGGEFKLSTNVEKIEIGTGIKIASSKMDWTFDQCFVGRHVSAEFFIKKKCFKTDIKTNLYSSLLIKVEYEEIFFEYINFVGHPYIGAMQFERVSNGARKIGIICLIASFPEDADSDEWASQALGFLESNGVIRCVNLLESYLYRLESYSVASAELGEISAKSDGKLTVNIVDSLMQNIHSNLQTWESAFK